MNLRAPQFLPHRRETNNGAIAQCKHGCLTEPGSPIYIGAQIADGADRLQERGGHALKRGRR